MKQLTIPALLALSVCAWGNNTQGATASDSGTTCPNYYQQVINPSTPCFGSRYPLMVAGQITIQGDGRADPPGRTTQSTCYCGKFPGVTRGYWHPTRIVDVTKRADCSPSLGQMPQVKQYLSQMANISDAVKYGGGVEDTTGSAKPQGGFFHVHSWRYPDYVQFQGLSTWQKGGYYEGSLNNPYWASTDETTANWLYPEMAGVMGSSGGGDIFSLAAIAASCLAETAGMGQLLTDNAYWLGGCMENALPTVGHTSGSGHTVQAHSTILMRYLNMSNRTNGFAHWKNLGDSALCSAHGIGFAGKSDFKVAMLAPYSENSSGGVTMGADTQSAIQKGDGMGGFNFGNVTSFLNITSRCDHHMGASEYRWGLGRSDQATKQDDEDATYLIWRWVDKCMLFGAF